MYIYKNNKIFYQTLSKYRVDSYNTETLNTVSKFLHRNQLPLNNLSADMKTKELASGTTAKLYLTTAVHT